ncbi:unnamed protein product [Echinostoma caproni]|uniref:HECT domain-containing protein n=1 Tax=Echinostoma caproni TaxID=27848 RepID=A0A183B4G5_9TREM|nr:unnamed protein product [Echinostoma caproni]
MNRISRPISTLLGRVVPPTTNQTSTTTPSTTTTPTLNTSPSRTTVIPLPAAHYYYVPLSIDAQLATNVLPPTVTVSRTATPATQTSTPASTTATPSASAPRTVRLNSPMAEDPDPFLQCSSPHFASQRQRVLLPTVHLTSTPVVTAVVGSRPTTTSSGTPGTATWTQMMPPNPTVSSQPPATTTTNSSTESSTTRSDSASNLRFPQLSSLPQQIAFFVSAATNAAASAASASGLHLNHPPFNFLIPSNPLQPTANVSRPYTNIPFAGTDSSDHNLSSGDPSVVAPSWAGVRGDVPLASLPSTPRSFTMFVECLVDAVWFQLSHLAREDGIDLNVPSSVWRPSQTVDRPPRNEWLFRRFLHDVVSTVQSELSVSRPETSPPHPLAPSGHGMRPFAELLDGIRPRLTHLVSHTDTAVRQLSENCLTDGLISLLFNDRVTDGDVPYSSESMESRAISWVCQRVTDTREVIDVRASLASVFRARPSQMEQCVLDDTDLEDLPFVDASSELPINNMEKPLCGSPLPYGVPKPGEIPEPISRALDPHPDSARSLLDAAVATNLPNPEGWHAALPPEWLHVVAGDVTNMNRISPSENGSADQFQRFSDAYIAGMPAKRRKVSSFTVFRNK